MPATQQVPKRRLASIQNAAEHVPCSTKTIRRRISDGTLTGYRFGKRIIRVDLNEIDALLRPIPSAKSAAGQDAPPYYADGPHYADASRPNPGTDRPKKSGRTTAKSGSGVDAS